MGFGKSNTQNTPFFTVDTTVIPFIAITVTLASILGAGFSARRIAKKSAVEILRMWWRACERRMDGRFMLYSGCENNL